MDQNYFAKKLAALQDASPKQKNVYEAFQEKLQALEAYSSQLAETKRQDDLARKSTTAGILNLDPYEDPISHTIVNTAALAGAVGSRIIGQVATAVEGAAKEGVGIGGIDENIREARARELKGEATQADLQLLDYAPRPLYGIASSKVKGQSNRERIQHWEKTQDDLAKTKEFFNIDSIVDRSVNLPFQGDLKQGAQQAGTEFAEGSAKLGNKDYLGSLANYASGAGTLAKNVVEAGVNNPLGAFNAVVENTPQLAAGIAFGLPGTLAVAGAYATDAYQEALETYRKEHNGAMPSKDWQKARMMEAAALMGAESISDRLADLEAKYKTADVLYTEMSRKSVSSSFKDTDVDAEIASGSPESIGKLKLLAMASPETAGVSLSIDQARTLASSTNPNVTVEDKKFFTAYADSLMKAKPLETMGKVAQEVLYGSKERDQKGLLDYRERFGLFMAQGNTAKADKELSDLAAFEANQKNKVDAINAAVKQFNQTSEAQIWAAAGFDDTLLRWKMKPEVVHGEKKDIQPRVQARGGQAGHRAWRGCGPGSQGPGRSRERAAQVGS